MTKREMLVVKAGQFPSLRSWLAHGASQAGMAMATLGAAAGLAALLVPTLFGVLKTMAGFLFGRAAPACAHRAEKEVT